MKQNKQSEREMTVLLILLSSESLFYIWDRKDIPTKVPPAAWGCGEFASYKYCFQSASTLG